VTDAALAALLAKEAGAILLALRANAGLEGKALGAAGDAAANAHLIARLKVERPGDAILSEEEADCTSRCANPRAWIIDPLDGTREYGEGRDDWAVHVALATDGVASVGAVALPSLDALYRSDAPLALTPANPRPRMVVSRSRPSALVLRAAEALGAQQIPMGSAGAKAMAVLRGEADIYLHSGGQFEWDNAAPVAVAMAAGLHASRIDGTPIVYNCEQPSVPDLLICHPDWAAPVLAAVALAQSAGTA
jgi:3'(2'), 5'-bisphosphate nucleotidase